MRYASNIPARETATEINMGTRLNSNIFKMYLSPYELAKTCAFCNEWRSSITCNNCQHCKYDQRMVMDIGDSWACLIEFDFFPKRPQKQA